MLKFVIVKESKNNQFKSAAELFTYHSEINNKGESFVYFLYLVSFKNMFCTKPRFFVPT